MRAPNLNGSVDFLRNNPGAISIPLMGIGKEGDASSEFSLAPGRLYSRCLADQNTDERTT